MNKQNTYRIYFNQTEEYYIDIQAPTVADAIQMAEDTDDIDLFTATGNLTFTSNGIITNA